MSVVSIVNSPSLIFSFQLKAWDFHANAGAPQSHPFPGGKWMTSLYLRLKCNPTESSEKFSPRTWKASMFQLFSFVFLVSFMCPRMFPNSSVLPFDSAGLIFIGLISVLLHGNMICAFPSICMAGSYTAAHAIIPSPTVRATRKA